MANRRFILGTAGHVDHGKTELVKRLTGWDTDRLKEEKERGISIELGFAPLRLGDGAVVGIIDVPGHERFVKNMVAGAGGIDMAILVVAADEAVMPQTKEHLEVLRSLAVDYGLVVLTKIDLTTPELIAIVKDDVAELVRGTFLEGAPIVETSARTGHGIDDLKSAVERLSSRVPVRDSAGPFRLAVDRVFHKQGIGVVVTGSCYSGTVSIGDGLELLPSGKPVRVREVQSFGERREQGFAGERLAIALQGKKLSEIKRGEMLVTPSKFVVSHMIDARVHVAGYATFLIKQRERIRLHHGAREVLGRVILLEADKLSSGESSLVQFRLEDPIVAGEGDHFVIRKYSPTRVLGGGRILDPVARKHRRFDERILEELHLQEQGDPRKRITNAVKSAGVHGVNLAEFGPVPVNELVSSGQLQSIEGWLFHPEVLEGLADELVDLIRQYLRANPLRFGIDKEELRQRVGFPHATSIFNRVLESLADRHRIFVRDNRVRCDSENLELPEALTAELTRLEEVIRVTGVTFSSVEEIRETWGGKHPIHDALQLLGERGAIVRIDEDAYIHRDALEACLDGLRGWFASHEELPVTAFKDLVGVTRKHAIPLLEYLDRERYTRRDGNIRRAGARLPGSPPPEQE